MTWDETPANPALDEDLNRALRSPAPESLAAGVAARLVLARAARRRRLRRGAIGAGLAIVVLMAGFLARPAPAPAPTHLLVIQEPLADRLARVWARPRRASRLRTDRAKRARQRLGPLKYPQFRRSTLGNTRPKCVPKP